APQDRGLPAAPPRALRGWARIAPGTPHVALALPRRLPVRSLARSLVRFPARALLRGSRTLCAGAGCAASPRAPRRGRTAPRPARGFVGRPAQTARYRAAGPAGGPPARSPPPAVPR